MEEFSKKLVVKTYKVVTVLGYFLLAIEFPELLNEIFATDTFGNGAITVSLIAFCLLAVCSYSFKQEGYE